MIGERKVLGLIPARGGSKGVPRKNIREVRGKPLIAWTIEAAKRSKLLDRFVVSTEDPEIAVIARQYGAEVIDRPAELANDAALSIDVVKHVLSLVPAETMPSVYLRKWSTSAAGYTNTKLLCSCCLQRITKTNILRKYSPQLFVKIDFLFRFLNSL